MPVATNKRKPRAQNRKADTIKMPTKPDFKIINFNRVAAKMDQKHKNLYPTLRLFARGLTDNVNPEILREFLSIAKDEFAKIEASVSGSIKALETDK